MPYPSDPSVRIQDKGMEGRYYRDPKYNVLARLLPGHRWLPDLQRIAVRLASTLRGELREAEYIGPLRELPERLYTASGIAAGSVGKSGKWLAEVLYRRGDLLEATNQILSEFGVPYNLRVDPLGENDVEDVFRLRLEDLRTRTEVSLLDVGFGVSQVLPVVVQSMLSARELLLIEQPEIHVHPRLQAELGSLFHRCINGPFFNQFIIETHSEHIMRRLQRHVRNGELPPTDVCVIYITRNEEGSVAHHLRLDDKGDFIDEWPEGFFEDAFNEAFVGW
jgi:hypothetical protein